MNASISIALQASVKLAAPEFSLDTGVPMTLMGWFDTKEVDEFAKAVVDDLAGRLPIEVRNDRKKATPDRLRNTQEAVVARVQSFARTHRLNWYKKARLGNTFHWLLIERGYDKAFADTWTRSVVLAATNSGTSQATPK